MRYLRGTLDYELCYSKCDAGVALIGYSDADWASSVAMLDTVMRSSGGVG